MCSIKKVWNWFKNITFSAYLTHTVDFFHQFFSFVGVSFVGYEGKTWVDILRYLKVSHHWHSFCIKVLCLISQFISEIKTFNVIMHPCQLKQPVGWMWLSTTVMIFTGDRKKQFHNRCTLDVDKVFHWGRRSAATSSCDHFFSLGAGMKRL